MSAQPAAIATPPPDAELLQRIREGDSRAAELLMRRHNRKLYRTARAILRDDAEAEDALQEAYLRAFRSSAGFRGEASVSTWLVRVVANEALMRRRREMRRSQVIPIDSRTGESAMTLDEFADTGAPGPEREAYNTELRKLLEKRIDALPDLYRPVFVMRAVEEMTVEETAVALDLPEATVRTRFFRARAILRGELEGRIDHTLQDVFAFAGTRCDRIVARVLMRLGETARET